MYYVWLSVAKGENLLVASLSEKGLTYSMIRCGNGQVISGEDR